METTDEGNFCLCSTTLTETAAYFGLPTRAQVLDLQVGAWDPNIFDENEYTVVGAESSDPEDVTVYKRLNEADYSTETIFRVVKDDFTGDYIYLKNILSQVTVCNGAFSFRTPPTFYDIADPELVSGYHETDTYIDHVINHPNTPPFVCKRLLKHFGYSNASPQHVLDCSTAFKLGYHTFTNPSDNTDTLTFGVAGQRGNLAAIAAAMVLSNDALSPAVDLDPTSGAVKNPLLRLAQLLRSFKLTRTTQHRRVDGLLYANLVGEGVYDIPDRESILCCF